MSSNNLFGLAGLNEFGVAPAPQSPMWWWQGVSGHWYIHSVTPFSIDLYFGGANYIFVRREFDGRRSALYIGQSDRIHERLPRHEKLNAARDLGVNELHVHLLARTEAERFDIETDLRNGHQPPLNKQANPYAASSSLGLASPLASTGPFGVADALTAFGIVPLSTPLSNLKYVK
jgi:hypothetical protein